MRRGVEAGVFWFILPRVFRLCKDSENRLGTGLPKCFSFSLIPPSSHRAPLVARRTLAVLLPYSLRTLSVEKPTRKSASNALLLYEFVYSLRQFFWF